MSSPRRPRAPGAPGARRAPEKRERRVVRKRIPERVTWGVEQLDLRRGDRILEIGCGPGHAVGLVGSALERGSIVAIDRSALQVARARAENRELIAAGRARIETTTLEQAPRALGERSFDTVFAINVNAFWTEPAPSFERARRLLRPRGRVVLVYEPPSAERAEALRRSLPKLLEAHGFIVEERRSARFARGFGICIVARAASRKDEE